MDGRSARGRAAALIVGLVLAVLGCAAPAQTPVTPTQTPVTATQAPSATSLETAMATLEATPSMAASGLPAQTAPPPSGGRPFPATSEVPLSPGRYLSSPPFDIPFTFDVPEGGWESAHLLGEFLDIVRFDADAAPGQPTRWIAFAHPTNIRGATEEPFEDLSPADAAALLADRPDLRAGPTSAFELDGLLGTRLDLHALVQSAPLFGGPAGNFGLDPENDVRLGIVPWADGLLLVLVLAAPDELDAAWLEAQPILQSVRL